MRRILWIALAAAFLPFAAQAQQALCPNYGEQAATHPAAETNYTLSSLDQCKLLVFQNTSAETVTIPNPGAFFPAGWTVSIREHGVGGLTLQPPSGSSVTIQGGSTFQIVLGGGVRLYNDNANWWTTGRGGPGYAPALIQCGKLIGANFNVTTDQAIAISVPTTNYFLDQILVGNASISLTTAVGGVYGAASKGSPALVAATQAYSTLTAAAVNAAGSEFALTLAAASTTAMLNFTTIYLSLTTAQGAAATADVRVFCRPLG